MEIEKQLINIFGNGGDAMPTEYDVLMDGDRCPQCNFGSMIGSNQRDDDGTPIYLSCTECDTHQLTYIPMPHQDNYHSDPAKIKGFFGGYG